MSKLFPTKKDAYRQGMERGVDLGIDQGVSLEQERIVELLKSLDPWGEIDTAFVPELIALIKGEQK